jgi:HSP20 family molecular chaperone IbpA
LFGHGEVCLRAKLLSTASDKINAEFKDGMLKLHLPKDEKAKPKTVDVKIG